MKKMIKSLLILLIAVIGINGVNAQDKNCSEYTYEECPSYDTYGNKCEKRYDYYDGNFCTQAIFEDGKIIKTVSCGNLDGIPAALPQFIKNIINIIKIAVPIILVIIGMLDFAKAVVSNDEKTMKESQNKFIKRVIAAIAVFLVVSIVQLIFRVINTDDTNEMASCLDCFINGDCITSNSSPDTSDPSDDLDDPLTICKQEAINACREQCRPSESFTGDPELDALLGTGGSLIEYNRCAARCELAEHRNCELQYGTSYTQ